MIGVKGRGRGKMMVGGRGIVGWGGGFGVVGFA